MKRWYLTAGLLICTAPLLLGQSATTNANNSSTDQGTTQVQPKPVQLNQATIRAAQKQLKARGYEVGPENGTMGPTTQAAVEKFQADEGLTQNGKLDAATLSKLGVGGTRVVESAPADLTRSGKTAGTDITNGHPVDAAKAVGNGSETFGKRVYYGAKSIVITGVRKVGNGMSKLGNTIVDKTEGNSGQTESSQANPPQQ